MWLRLSKYIKAFEVRKDSHFFASDILIKKTFLEVNGLEMESK